MSVTTNHYELLLAVKQNRFDSSNRLVTSVFHREFNQVVTDTNHLDTVYTLARGTVGNPSVRTVNLDHTYIPRLIIASSFTNDGFQVEWTPNQSRAATATIVIASNVQANDEVTINQLTYTFRNQGQATQPGHIELQQGAVANARALTAAINADRRIGQFEDVQAFSCNNVVTVYCTTPGPIGNSITLSTNANPRIVVSGPTLTGGLAATQGQWPGRTPIATLHMIRFPDCLDRTTQAINLINPNLFEVRVRLFVVA